MSVTRQLYAMAVIAIDFHSIFFTYGSQCLVTSILQNIYFVLIRGKKLTPVWNILRVRKWWENFHSVIFC